ncbi:MAG: hypothetical protein AAF984_10820 [Verrucomicrobiota bacterium]
MMNLKRIILDPSVAVSSRAFRYSLRFVGLCLLALLSGCVALPEKPDVDLSQVAVVKGKMGSFLLDAYDNATVIIHDVEEGVPSGRFRGGYYVRPGLRHVAVQLSGPYYEERFTVFAYEFEVGKTYRIHGSIGFKNPSTLRLYDETDADQPVMVARYSFRDKPLN